MRRNDYVSAVFGLVVLLGCAVSWAGPVRTWTDKQGNQIKAEFVRIHDGNVILKQGRRVVSVPFGSLGDEDQAYVRSEMEAEGQGHLVPRTTPRATDDRRARPDLRSGKATPAIEVPKRRVEPNDLAGKSPGREEIPENLEPSRTWTDIHGNAIRGQFITVSGYEAVLWKDGKRVHYPLVGLSIADRTYVRTTLEARGLGHLFPGRADPDDEATHLTMSPQRWREQLARWRTSMRRNEPPDGEETREAARKHIRNICDPNAVTLLINLLGREKDDDLREACVEALARIGGPQVIRTLVRLSVTDPSPRVRAAATWGIMGMGNSGGALAEYAAFVRGKQTRREALALVQRIGLLRRVSPGELPDQAMTHALIDALVDVHTEHVPYRWWTDTGWRVMPHMTDRGYHAHRHRRSGVTKVPVQVPDPQPVIRQVLVDYTGEDYGYDQQAWKRWYQERKDRFGKGS